jgi:hypothetical protein
LWLVSYLGGEFRRLTNDVSQYIGLSLTAGGDELVTMRAEALFSIWTSDASAARWTETVAQTPVKGPIGFGVAWLGDDLLFPSSASGAWAVERWRASTRATDVVAPAGGFPQASRDGSTIVYGDLDAFQWRKIDADGRTEAIPLENHYIEYRLTPDGRQLAYVESIAGGPVTVRLRSIDGTGAPRDVTADRVAPGRAHVSPDGRWIAYPSFDDRNEPVVAVCDLETCSSKRTLPFGLHWTPDSRGLAYVDPRTSSDIWIQPIDGGPPRQLTRFPPDGRRIIDFAWSADGQRLAVARYSTTNNIVLFRGLKPPAEK